MKEKRKGGSVWNEKMRFKEGGRADQ